jgi:hypothetical protein
MENLVVYQDDNDQTVGICSYDAYGRRLEREIAEVANNLKKETSKMLHSSLPSKPVAIMIAKRVAEWKGYTLKEVEEDAIE